MNPNSRTTQEDGQTMAEYAVVLGVISVVVLAALGFFSDAVASRIDAIASLIP